MDTFVKTQEMQVFYAPDIAGDSHRLDENESKHLVRVLRMTKGTQVKLIDGKGSLYDGVIDIADPKECRIKVTGVTPDFEKRDYRLHIAISPLKNTERFEWFLEKCVEIGVDEITPLICRNTEKRNIRADRMDSIIISAMKQSLKALKPVFNDACRFEDFIKQDGKCRLIAHCRDSVHRDRIRDVCSKGDEVVILIGPEGDFSAEEIHAATEAGFRSVHLGRSRLRTETAGIAACHSVYFINQ